MNDIYLKALSDHNVDLKNSTIIINGDIDENIYEKLVQDISLFKAFNPDGLNNLTVYLSTYGGDVYYGFAMYDFLKLNTKDLKIICSGPVMSAGSLILQAASERLMMKNSSILVHFGFEYNESQQTKHHNEYLTKQLKNVLIERCTAKEQTIKKWFTKESFFNPKRALSVGLVDKVI